MDEALVFEAKLDRGSIPAEQPATELQCHLKLWSSTALGQGKLSSIATNICLVFDCSSSMWGEKLQTGIESAKMIVDSIQESHTISLVAFQSKTKLLVDNAQATEADKEKIKDQIDDIADLVGGFTDTAAGIRTGLQAMANSKAAAKIMLILTDGDADSPGEAEQAAHDATKAGIQLFAVGIGSDYDAEHMLKLVKASNGTVFGEKDLDKIKVTFAKLIGRVGNLVAANARISMKFHVQVKPKRAYKTSPEQAFLGELSLLETNLSVGNIERGKVYGFMAAIEVPQHNVGKLEIARAILTYDMPAANIFGQSEEVSIVVNYTESTHQSVQKSGDLWETAKRARLAELAERFVDAYNRADQHKAIRYMEVLVQDSEQLGDQGLQIQYSRLLNDLRQNRSIGRDKLNSMVVSSLQIVEPKPVAPQPVAPQPVAPQPVAPRPVAPQPVAPRPVAPQPVAPKPVAPKPVAPKPVAPRPVAPKPPAPRPKPPKPPAPPPKEPTPTAPVVRLFDVVLSNPGDSLILLIRVLRDITGLSLHEVGDMVQNPGSVVGESMTQDEANELKGRLEEHGAQIEVRPCEPNAGPSNSDETDE